MTGLSSGSGRVSRAEVSFRPPLIAGSVIVTYVPMVVLWLPRVHGF
jgi:hypothetical protein